MFLYDGLNKQNQTTNIFKKEPIMSRLSHSFNDPLWSYPYHVHPEDTELIYFSKGEADYQINMEVFHVKKGDLLIVNKGCIHSITSSRTNPISCWTCGIMNYQMMDGSDIFLPLTKKPYCTANKHEQIIQDLFYELEACTQSNSKHSLSICNALASALAHIYYDIYQEAQIDSTIKKASFVQDVLFYINENYAKNITLKDLSQHFHISADHISHVFTQTYHVSPINYAIDRRISEAKWMLINTNDSLTSISLKVGYENTTHFSKLFLKRVGYPPLVYREKFGMDLNHVYK